MLGNLRRSHAQVLAALEPGGILDALQLADSTALSVRAARKAVRDLESLGHVVNVPRFKWQLSPSGKSFLKTSAGRSTLDYGRSRK